MKSVATLLLAALAASPAAADPVALATAETAAFCTERGQTLQLGPNPLTEVDLTGDGTPDAIVSEAGASCQPDGGSLSGTGGEMIYAVVGDSVTARLALGWTVTTARFAPEAPEMTVLLVRQHGSACGGVGPDPCIEALVWAGDGFRSVMPPAEE